VEVSEDELRAAQERAVCEIETAVSAAVANIASLQAQITAAQTAHDTAVRKNKKLASVIIPRLGDSVIQQLHRSISDADKLDGIAVWSWLNATYGKKAVVVQQEQLMEQQLLSLLQMRPSNKKAPFSAFVSAVKTKLEPIRLSKRITACTSSAYRLIDSLVARHLLNLMKDDQRYAALHIELSVVLAHGDSFNADILSTLFTRVEQIDAVLLSTPGSGRQQHSGSASSSSSHSFSRDRRPHHPGGASPSGAAAASPSSSSSFQRGSAGGGTGGGKGGKQGGRQQGKGGRGPQGRGHSASANFLFAGSDGEMEEEEQLNSLHTHPLLSPSATTHLVAVVSSSTAKTHANHAAIVDSGASTHCFRDRSMFASFRPGKTVVRVANGKTMVSTGKGDVPLTILTKDGKKVKLILRDVLYTPQLGNNILSTTSLLADNSGFSVQLTGTHASIHLGVGNSNIVPLTLSQSLLWLIPVGEPAQRPSSAVKSTTAAASATKTVSLAVFHARMGHLSVEGCKAAAQAQGITLTGAASFTCEVCMLGKLKKKPITSLADFPTTPLRPGQYINMDIKGPLESAAYNGDKYAFVFVDVATRITITKTAPSKDRCVDVTKAALDDFATFPSSSIPIGHGTTLYSDAEVVIQSTSMMALLASRNISFRTSPPYAHEKNGIAERCIQTLFNAVRCLLQEGDLPDKFWTVALHHACYLKNNSPSSSLGGKSPMTVLTGAAKSTEHLRLFGSAVFVKVDETMREALSAKARKGVYVGHNDTSGCARVLMLDKSKLIFINSFHCVIDEKERPYKVLAAAQEALKVQAKTAAAVPPAPAPTLAPPLPSNATKEGTLPTPVLGQPPADSVARALAAGRDPLLDDFDEEDGITASVNNIHAVNITNPRSFRDAMRSEYSKQWQLAVDKEIASLVGKDTFVYVPESEAKGKKLISSRWVFTTKPLSGSEPSSGSSGVPVRFKARLVARGDTQRAGVDFDEVYAPVVNSSTLRALLAMAAIEDLDVDHMDVVTAFLNAPLEEELYLRIPDGFEARPGFVLRLKKSLYGLRQAPRCWNKTLHDWLLSYGLQQSQVDQSLYFIPNQLWVAVWVDDFIVAARDANTKHAFKSALSGQFEMQDLGPIHHFLGMEIARDRPSRTLTLTVTGHIDRILESFDMQKAHGTFTPMPTGTILEAYKEGDQVLPSHYPYRAVVGSLNYLVTWVRPDLAFAVTQLARHQERPMMRHWLAAKQCLRYLKATRTVGLTYSAQLNVQLRDVAAAVGADLVLPTSLHGYVDASWAEDLDTRRSQTGYVFCYGNAAISWNSHLQRLVTMSSTEAEYVALGEAVKEALYLRNLFSELFSAAPPSIPLFEDNQSTIKQALNTQSSRRTKHIDIRHHFLKQHVSNNVVTLHYIPTSLQSADCLTKCLDRVKVEFFRQIIIGS
jgi:hypothetical protein